MTNEQAMINNLKSQFGVIERAFKPVKTYQMYIKSGCEYPDFEVEVDARDKEEAFENIIKVHGRNLVEFDREFLMEHIYDISN